MENIGEYDFVVKGSELDYKAQISYAALMDIMLEAAGMHAEERGFGLADLMRSGRSWVLTRFRMDLLKSSKFDKKVKIRTWVDSVGEVFTCRKFRVFNQRGDVFAEASSTWALIDIRERKAVSLIGFLDDSVVDRKEGEGIQAPSRLETSGKMQAVRSFDVAYGDLDINRHVNSVKYLQWFLNAFSLDQFLSNRIKRLELNYIAEVLYGETATVQKSEGEVGTNTLELCSNEKVVCRLEADWEPLKK